MAEKIQQVNQLQLTLDHSRHRITRKGYPPVDLGGQCRLWKILTRLCQRYDGYLPKNDLTDDVWDDYGAVSVEEVTVYAAISELRSSLLPLALTIKHVKGIGYRLEKSRWKSAERRK
jgi:DNA-binding winged helix-turn-helix (wHTH) protein